MIHKHIPNLIVDTICNHHLDSSVPKPLMTTSKCGTLLHASMRKTGKF